MAKRLKAGSAKFYWVKVKEELADHVGIAHRADFEILARKEKVLAEDDGSGMVRFVEPVGMLKSLRKACVTVLGSAPSPIAV